MPYMRLEERLSEIWKSEMAKANIMRLDRRTLIVGVSALALVRSIGPAAAQEPSARDVVAAFTGGRTPAEERVQFEAPLTADNAQVVPVSIRIDSPMTEQDYCAELLIVAARNPRPAVCRLQFSPGVSVPQFATRIRLAETQSVLVLAKMNDGRVFSARRQVTVTAGACAT
jgi:sulfur-oxidizing protein SoxY